MYDSGLIVIGLLGAIAGLLSALYVTLRVRPGLSLALQRRALSFLGLSGLFLAVSQAPLVLGTLLWPGGAPGIYLAAWSAAAGVAAAACVILAAHFVRRSELK